MTDPSVPPVAPAEGAAGGAAPPRPAGSDRRMPVAFIGHGNPMYAIVPNRYADAWSRLAGELPRPRAILSVSAHWFVPELSVTAMDRPRTIHDFGGFPEELFAVTYPARGSRDLAERVRSLLAPESVGLDSQWGLDHGTWSVLRRAYPEADIPVVQLSIDSRVRAIDHLNFGAALAPLRDEGVLIMCSGNIVHNLRLVQFGDGAPAFDWALRFDAAVRERLSSGDGSSLADLDRFGPDARLSVPTPEHFLPLLYAVGAAGPDDPVRFPVDGIDASSLSMLSVVFG